MSAFDCLNGEVFLANECYAFYTATNTFRNPVFNCSTNDQDLLDVTDESNRNTTTTNNNNNNNASQSHGPAGDGQAQKSHKKSKNKASKSASSTFVSLVSHTKEKCAEFCDNFAFSLRDKLFIMETNFKRRLRQLTRFMNKKLGPHWHPSSTITMARSQEEAMGRFGLGGPASELERNGRREFKANSSRREKRPQLFNLTEPLSAEALGIQQERILSRLERIKRTNQRLLLPLSSSSSSFSSTATVTGIGDDNKGQDGARRQRIPKSASSGIGGSRSNESQMTIPIWLRSASSGPAISSPADWPEAAHSRSFSNTGFEENDEYGGQVAACNHTAASQLDASKATPRSTTTTTTTEEATKRTNVATKNRRANTSGRWSSISSGVRRQTKRVRTHFETDSADEKKTCIVCYERPPNILTFPCEHSDICSDCFIEIIYMAVKNSQYPLRCVLCRQKIERIRCSRRLMLNVIKRNRMKSANSSLLSL